MSDENTNYPVTGEHLKEWGHRPGKQFPALLTRADFAAIRKPARNNSRNKSRNN